MKKVLQLNATANWGSTGKIAEGIGLAALERGWESYIAYGRYSNPSQSNLIKVGNQWDVYSHYAQNRFLDREGLGSVRPTKKLIAQIKEIKPDIIHLHNIHDHWLNYPILFKYLQSVDTPVVWTFHDCWAFTGGCAHFITNGCEQWKINCSHCQFRHLPINRSEKNLKLKSDLFLKFGNRLSIVSVSHWLDSLVSKSKLKNLNHGVIYNGVDLDVFKPTDGESINQRFNLQDKFVILGVSSVWPESKGLSDFLKLRKLLNDRFVIILIGLPRNVINTLPAGIIGVERTTNVDELASFYTRADVIMSLSKAETFGLTLVEGQACGTPSIGYDCTAVNEVITEATGFKFQIGDFDSIVSALNNLVSNNPFNSEEIREPVNKKFNSNTQYNKYIDLYESLIRVNL